MAVFQVSSKRIPSATPPPRRRRRRLPREWAAVISVSRSIAISALLFGLIIFVWPFSGSNRKARKALDAFTGSLREVIDLKQLRESSLAVVQQMMQPAVVALWVRLNARQQEVAGDPAQITCQVTDDPNLLTKRSFSCSIEHMYEVERFSTSRQGRGAAGERSAGLTPCAGIPAREKPGEGNPCDPGQARSQEHARWWG